MAAGYVTLDVRDSANVTRKVRFWSSDGSATGDLTSAAFFDADQIADLASEVTLAAVLAKLSADPATETKLEAVRALLAGTLTAAPSAAQDPIFDHANGEKETVTASAVVFTPPAGCYFAHFDANVETFIRTDNVAAADAAGARRLIADQGEILPVTPGVDVLACCATSAVLRIIPMKVRS